MNTFQLTCFLAMADCLSFAQTARRLHVTQPAVTYQIKALEQELGVPLFVRKHRGADLTPEGCGFLEDARTILALETRAKSRFDGPKTEE